MDIEQLFLDWLKLNKLSERTIKEYIYFQNKFKDYDGFNQENINHFLLRNNNGVARAFLKNLREFLLDNAKQLELTNEKRLEIAEVRIKKYKGRNAPKKPKEIITIDEFKMLYEACKDEMAKIMLLISFYCGLRKAELLSLRTSNFDWNRWQESEESEMKNGVLTIKGKGGYINTQFVLPEVMDILREYIQKLALNKDFTRETLLFQVNERIWNRWVQRIGKKVLNKSVYPHMFRRSIATYLNDKEWNLLDIKEFLRHKNISTTQLYIKIDKKKLDEKYANAFD